MKKKMVLVVLAVLLLAGTAFAAPTSILGQTTLKNKGWPIKIEAASLQSSMSRLEVTYSAASACGTLDFWFKVYYKDSSKPSGENYQFITNKEVILFARKASTWRFTIPNNVINNFIRLEIEIQD